MNCAPAVLAIARIPLLNLMIEEIGWRWAYVILGRSACPRAIAVRLIPPAPPKEDAVPSHGSGFKLAPPAIIG